MRVLFFIKSFNAWLPAGIYFDGKEGTSLVRIGRRNDFMREETYAIVGYPGKKSKYLKLIKFKGLRKAFV